jgi:hypothetical protein
VLVGGQVGVGVVEEVLHDGKVTGGGYHSFWS